jgi:hypothetical protein
MSSTQQIFWHFGARFPRIRNIDISSLSVEIEKRLLVSNSENKNPEEIEILKRNVSYFLQSKTKNVN